MLFRKKLLHTGLAIGLYESHILELREQLNLSKGYICRRNFRTAISAYARHWEKSEGGFYIWLRFNEPIVNKSFFLNLFKKNVLINPGYIYDTSDLHHIRLSYAYASLEEIKEGLNIVVELTCR